MEILTEPPRSSSFVPLAEHQSATPASFHAGPPVLHYYSDRCQVILNESEARTSPALLNFISKAPANSESAEKPNGSDADADADVDVAQRKVVEEVDVWVTSDKLFIYSTALSTGISIPYPTISLHAIQSQPEPSSIDTSSQGLYMQLVSMSGDTTQSEDTEPDSISMTVIPTASAPPQAASNDGIDGEELPEQTPVLAMFTALSNCSNLHPDPDDDDEIGVGGDGSGLAGSVLYQSGMLMPGGTDGGLPPPMPGSGGWITAENMHEYFDEEGNWIGPEDGDGMVEDGGEEETAPLGPGAGTTRHRNGEDTDMNGDDETKWRRTE